MCKSSAREIHRNVVAYVDSILLYLTDAPNAQITSRRIWREYEHFFACLQTFGDKNGEMRFVKSCSERKHHLFHPHVFKTLDNYPTKTFWAPISTSSVRDSRAVIVVSNHQQLRDGARSSALSLLEAPLISCRKRNHWFFRVYSTRTAPPDSQFVVVGPDR